MTEIRLQFLSEEDGFWMYRFGDLVFRTESLATARADRVIPLGGAAGRIMSFMVRHQDLIRGRRVLEPFSGCGPLGLLAIHLGARHVCCADINPRAMAFLDYNLERNSLDPARLTRYVGDVLDFVPDEPFDWLLANPPFVPTPDGIQGAIHSAAGLDGNRLSSGLLSRLSSLLRPTGQALLSVFQIEARGEPLLARFCREKLGARRVEFTKGNQYPQIPLQDLVNGYREKLPDQRPMIDAWEERLTRDFGADLSVDSYAIHIGPEEEEAGVALRPYDGTKYGEGFFKPRKSARGVAHENLPGLV